MVISDIISLVNLAFSLLLCLSMVHIFEKNGVGILNNAMPYFILMAIIVLGKVKHGWIGWLAFSLVFLILGFIHIVTIWLSRNKR